MNRPTASANDDSSPNANPLRCFRTNIRVNYHETDGQQRVHHGNYTHYFERGRVEMLRAGGISYKQLEQDGKLLVVTEMNISYHSAAEFDDLLTLTTETIEVRKVRIRHRYALHRGEELIVQAHSTIACVNSEGKPSRLPKEFLALQLD